MKRVFLVGLLVGLGFQGFSQEEERTIKFENGRTATYQFLTNDPAYISPWYAGVGVYINRFGMGGQLEGSYQFDKIRLDASLQIGTHLDFLIDYNDNSASDEIGLFTNFNLDARYPLLERIKTKEANITIDQESTGYNVTTNYLVKQKLSYKRSLNAIGGLQFIDRAVAQAVDLNASDNTNTQGPNYFVGSVSNVNLKLGLSYDLGTAYAYKLDGDVRLVYAQTSFYANVLVGMATTETAYNDQTASGVEEVSSGYDDPEVSPFGVLVGYKAMYNYSGAKNFIMGWGLEGGLLPGLADDSNWYAGFNYSIGLVPDIKKGIK